MSKAGFERIKMLTLHGSDISALDVVLKLGEFLLEFIQGDLLILCSTFS